MEHRERSYAQHNIVGGRSSRKQMRFVTTSHNHVVVGLMLACYRNARMGVSSNASNTRNGNNAGKPTHWNAVQGC